MKATQAKAPEQKLQEKPCCICQKLSHGYGTWSHGLEVTCSRNCEEVKSFNESILEKENGKQIP